MDKFDFYFGSYRILYRLAPGKVILLTSSILNSLLYTPIYLFLTKVIIDKFQYGSTEKPNMDIIILTALLALLMLVSGLVFGTFTAMALSGLADIGDLEKERILVEKSTQLNLIDAESPVIADMRDRAMKVSIVQIFQDGGELLGKLMLIIVLLVILTLKGHWGLTLGTCFISALSILIYTKSSESMEQLNRKQTGDRRMLEYLFDILTGKQTVREIRVFNAADYLKEKKYRVFEKYRSEKVRQGIKTESLRLLTDFAMAAAGGILAVIIAILVNDQKGSAGDYLIIFQSAAMLYSSLPGFMSLTANMKAYAIKWNDFETFLNLEEEQQYSGEQSCNLLSDKVQSNKLPNSRGEEIHLTPLAVEVDNLTFSYPNTSRPAINNVSFRIAAGCKVAIVGENGSGKSTLVKLLLGLYKPEKGHVKWIQDQQEISISEARRNCSVVFQDFARFNLTIRENVALGDTNLLNDDIKLKEALEKAQVYVEAPANTEFEMLDKQLGAGFGGLELSGGQWQRLATSRAYLHDGIFVFFDEPTAALDPKAEEKAFNTFLNMTKGKSAVLVTHRLGAVRMADYILVLKDGKLIEQGTHEELMHADGEYARMFEKQAFWYSQELELLNGSNHGVRRQKLEKASGWDT